MPLSTYAELQASVAGWLNRDDLTAQIRDFIALTEAQFQRDVRHRNMVKTADLTIAARYVDMPADHLKTMRLDCNGNRLTAISTDDMLERRYTGSAGGQPRNYAPIGAQLEVFPTPDATYAGSLQYYGKIPALSVAAPTNWLLEAAPDAYLYGALLHSAPYLIEDARANTWGGLYGAAVKNLNDTDEMGRWGGNLVIPARRK